MVRVPDEVVRREVKEVRLIEVSRELYRAAVSFVNSSSKPGYMWNQGVRVGDHVKFVKPRKWVLHINTNPEIIPHELYSTCPILIDSLIGDGSIGICLKYQKYPEDLLLTLTINDSNVKHSVSFTADYEWSYELASTALYNKDVKFSYPVLLITVVERINEYVDIPRYYYSVRNQVLGEVK